MTPDIAGSGLLLAFYRETLGRRVAAVLLARESSDARSRTLMMRGRELFYACTDFASTLLPKSGTELSAAQKRLTRAGYRNSSAARVLFGAKLIVPVLACLIAFVTGLFELSPLLVFGACLLMGYLLPDFYLDHRIGKRSVEINRGLPDVLDLLVVCLEAGLSLDQGVMRVIDETGGSFPALADEIGLVMLEVRAGRPRVTAWRSLVERTRSDQVRALVAILTQADQFGTGISKNLRIHSETMRTRQRQRVEEQAAKTAVKLVFPLLLFIFPTVWVVVLGPAVIMIAENLK